MSILDTTIVNVALATLSRELHSTIAQIQWVVTGYMLSLAAVIPVSGWAARRFGAKQVYLVSRRAVHRRIRALRTGDVDDRADPVPRPPGRRRRHDPAGRAADDGRGRRAEADGTGDERRRGPRDARADPRPHDRRTDHPEHELAVDLLRQRPDRRDRRSDGAALSPVAQARGGRQARRPWPDPDGDRPPAADLRLGRDRRHRQLHLGEGGSSRSSSASRWSRRSCSTR